MWALSSQLEPYLGFTVCIISLCSPFRFAASKPLPAARKSHILENWHDAAKALKLPHHLVAPLDAQDHVTPPQKQIGMMESKFLHNIVSSTHQYLLSTSETGKDGELVR
jgi:hypothetical protein